MNNFKSKEYIKVDEKNTNDAVNERVKEQQEQEVSESVEANVEMDRVFYANDEQSFDKYFLSDASRNGS
jgi:hypothetical protein